MRSRVPPRSSAKRHRGLYIAAHAIVYLNISKYTRWVNTHGKTDVRFQTRASRLVTATARGFYYGQRGWQCCAWEGVQRIAFRFRRHSGGPAVDTTGFLHAGDAEGHVLTGAPHADFAGIVCIED